MNGDLAKKCFDRADLRNAGIGKSTKIILYRGKILGHIRIPHGKQPRFSAAARSRIACSSAPLASFRETELVKPFPLFMALPAVGTT